MKTFVAVALALTAGTNALVSRANTCCFGLTASGANVGQLPDGQNRVVGQLPDGQNRIVGQISDGQNRVGGNLPAGSFCIDSSNGAITDGAGRGCILTSATTQFQCDMGKTPATGFVVGCDGILSRNGNSRFFECPTGQDSQFNIYVTPPAGQQGCSAITLIASTCRPNCPSSSMSMSRSSSSSRASSQASSQTTSRASSQASSQMTSRASSQASSQAAAQTTSRASSQASSQASSPMTSRASSQAPPQMTSSAAPQAPAPAQKQTASQAPSQVTVTVYTCPQAAAAAPSQTPSQAPAKAASSAPSPAAPAAPSKAPAQKQCPASLSGPFEFPHLIIPINSASPNQAAGTSSLNGQISSTVSSIFNFDIPPSDAGKTCSLVFLFPKQSDLQTSSFTFSGTGGIDFSSLTAAATLQTTFANRPSMAQDFGVTTVAPGNSYNIASFACPAGQKVAFEARASGNTNLNFFQDFNPSPIGLYITVC